MSVKGLEQLEIAGNREKQLGMAKMAENGLNGLKWLDMNGMAGNADNCGLEIPGSCWKLL